LFLYKKGYNITDRDYLEPDMRLEAKEIGTLVYNTRKSLGVTQRDLARTSGTGLRFIIELEKGKPTCQLAKVLTVLQTLGIKITLSAPRVNKND